MVPDTETGPVLADMNGDDMQAVMTESEIITPNTHNAVAIHTTTAPTIAAMRVQSVSIPVHACKTTTETISTSSAATRLTVT